MNDVFMHIFLRRAIREYRPDDIPDDLLRELIKAGIYAPSSLNEQPWRFVVIKNQDLLKRCSDVAKRHWLDHLREPASEATKDLVRLVSDPGFNIFYGAPVLVLLFSPPGADSPEIGCALAAENMMLAASSIGIGSCWIGLAAPLGSDRGLLEEIGVPADHRLRAQLIFGYPSKKETVAPERNKDVILKWIR